MPHRAASPSIHLYIWVSKTSQPIERKKKKVTHRFTLLKEVQTCSKEDTGLVLKKINSIPTFNDCRRWTERTKQLPNFITVNFFLFFLDFSLAERFTKKFVFTLTIFPDSVSVCLLCGRRLLICDYIGLTGY